MFINILSPTAPRHAASAAGIERVWDEKIGRRRGESLRALLL
jgi:hypothetical protein